MERPPIYIVTWRDWLREKWEQFKERPLVHRLWFKAAGRWRKGR